MSDPTHPALIFTQPAYLPSPISPVNAGYGSASLECNVSPLAVSSHSCDEQTQQDGLETTARVLFANTPERVLPSRRNSCSNNGAESAIAHAENRDPQPGIVPTHYVQVDIEAPNAPLKFPITTLHTSTSTNDPSTYPAITSDGTSGGVSGGSMTPLRHGISRYAPYGKPASLLQCKMEQPGPSDVLAYLRRIGIDGDYRKGGDFKLLQRNASNFFKRMVEYGRRVMAG
ncbi:hypothetical protein BASA60_000824 [Batrachochytrium salamandrivorans]|nr:hypothetical protein BASA60_000824 [Batrachochytrium salamandrivorans]